MQTKPRLHVWYFLSGPLHTNAHQDHMTVEADVQLQMRQDHLECKYNYPKAKTTNRKVSEIMNY